MTTTQQAPDPGSRNGNAADEPARRRRYTAAQALDQASAYLGPAARVVDACRAGWLCRNDTGLVVYVSALGELYRVPTGVTTAHALATRLIGDRARRRLRLRHWTSPPTQAPTNQPPEKAGRS